MHLYFAKPGSTNRAPALPMRMNLWKHGNSRIRKRKNVTPLNFDTLWQKKTAAIRVFSARIPIWSLSAAKSIGWRTRSLTR